MTEEVRARIFDAFYSTRPGGSGLGLPTTRKIVEAHGGTIDVQSVPGQGLAVHDPATAWTAPANHPRTGSRPSPAIGPARATGS